MCGRFTLRTPAEVLAALFELPEEPALEPRYNIAPTQPVAVVRAAPGRAGRELAMLRWGLIPSWAGEPGIGNRMINARAETVSTRPAYRSAFHRRRCLVPADGFYEWQRLDGKKQPFYIWMRGGGPFAFAGLWDHWHGAEESIDSCTLLTTAANDLVRPIHDRMPVILAPDDYGQWLDPEVPDPRVLEPLLRPYASQAMTAYPVKPWVNNPRNTGPRCIEPLSG